MTRAKSMGYRLRWVMLVLGVGLTGVGVLWMFWPVITSGGTFLGYEPMGLGFTPAMLPVEFSSDATTFFINSGFYLGVFFLTQWVFLRPRREMMVAMVREGRPMKRSVVVAGLMATLLTTGLVATLLEIPNWWWKVCEMTSIQDEISFPGEYPFFGIWIAMAIMWGIWSWIFYIYWRSGDHYTQYSKMVRGFIAGSILELMVATPVQAFCYSRDDCHCARGSYTGLVFGGTVLLWAFGPGIVLLFLREKYRRAKLLEPFCLRCNYDLTGSKSDVCPECGQPVREGVRRGIGEMDDED